MKRIIVDYSKLTNEILTLLLERFPDGYDDSHIIRFRNAQNELIEAVEVRTSDTIYLVKVSTKLASRLEKFEEEDDLDDVVEPIDAIKDIDMDTDEDDDDEDQDNDRDREDDEDEEDEDFDADLDKDEDEDEDDDI